MALSFVTNLYALNCQALFYSVKKNFVYYTYSQTELSKFFVTEPTQRGWRTSRFTPWFSDLDQTAMMFSVVFLR